MSIAEESDRALAAWVLGDQVSRATLTSLAAIVEGRDALAALVQRDGDAVDVVATDASAREASLLTRIEGIVAPRRAFHTPRDDRWASLWGGHAHAGSAAWVACEPVLEGPKTRATIVVVGFDEKRRDEVLMSLPRLARVSATVLTREENERLSGTATHAIRNLLASLLVNGEYALSLVDEGGKEDADSASTRRAHLVEAVRNTLHAAQQLTAHVNKLTDAARALRR